MDNKLELLRHGQFDYIGLSQTRRKLAWTFARVFDCSYVKSVCSMLSRQQSQPGIEFLGDGAHCFTYRLFTGKSMDLAISLAKPNFFDSLSHGSITWPELMDQLSRLDHPLIPPFAVIQEKHQWLAYARPYCPQTIEELSPNRQSELESLKLSLLRDLHEKSLIIDDYLQIRGCDDHPFVIDWSDLVHNRQMA